MTSHTIVLGFSLTSAFRMRQDSIISYHVRNSAGRRRDIGYVEISC